MRPPPARRFQRAVVAALGIGGLLACAQPAPAPGPAVTLGVVDDALAGPRIEATTTGPRALVRAELVMPDGSVSVGTIVDHEAVGGAPTQGVGDVGVGVGVFGGSSGRVGGGVVLGVPVFGVGRAAEPMIRSRARIAIPDLAAYRRDWSRARIRLSFTAGADGETGDLGAPQPGPRQAE